MARRTSILALGLLATVPACGAAPAPTASGPSNQAGAAEVVLLPEVPAQVGDRRRKRELEETTITSPASEYERKVVDSDVEVHAVRDGEPSQVRVTYAEHLRTTTRGAAPAPTPLHGQTFVITAEDDGFTAVDSSGTPVGEPIATLLKKEFRAFGQPDPIGPLLRGRAWRPGEPWLAPDVALAEASRQLELEVTSISIALESASASEACLLVEMALSIPTPTGVARADSAGPICVDRATGRAIRNQRSTTFTGALRGTSVGETTYATP
jgi:hypothetical protein